MKFTCTIFVMSLIFSTNAFATIDKSCGASDAAESFYKSYFSVLTDLEKNQQSDLPLVQDPELESRILSIFRTNQVSFRRQVWEALRAALPDNDQANKSACSEVVPQGIYFAYEARRPINESYFLNPGKYDDGKPMRISFGSYAEFQAETLFDRFMANLYGELMAPSNRKNVCSDAASKIVQLTSDYKSHAQAVMSTGEPAAGGPSRPPLSIHDQLNYEILARNCILSRSCRLLADCAASAGPGEPDFEKIIADFREAKMIESNAVILGPTCAPAWKVIDQVEQGYRDYLQAHQSAWNSRPRGCYKVLGPRLNGVLETIGTLLPCPKDEGVAYAEAKNHVLEMLEHEKEVVAIFGACP